MDKVNNKLFDRSSYSSTTISTYQIVGAYFVDVYYNHLYTEAIKFKTDGKVVSVTEGYRHATFAFLSALDNKAKGYRAEHYNRLLQGIHEYFVYWTTYSSLTLGDCIDKIVKEFIPADYFQSLTKEQKRNILRTLLIDSIRDFTKIVIEEYLGAIIDNHDESANVEALKEKIVDIFIMRRETMFHKFLDCRSGGKPTNDTVDKKFVDKLRSDYMKVCAVNEELLNQNKEMTAQLSTYTANTSEIIQRFKKLKMRYDSLAQELAISKQKNTELKEMLSAAQAPQYEPMDESYLSFDEPKLIVPEEPKHIHIEVPKSAPKPKPAIKSTKATIKKAVVFKEPAKPEIPESNELDMAISNTPTKHKEDDIGMAPSLSDIY